MPTGINGLIAMHRSIRTDRSDHHFFSVKKNIYVVIWLLCTVFLKKILKFEMLWICLGFGTETYFAISVEFMTKTNSSLYGITASGELSALDWHALWSSSTNFYPGNINLFVCFSQLPKYNGSHSFNNYLKKLFTQFSQSPK